MTSLDEATFDHLEADLARAFATGRPDGLSVLGYGEISLVVGVPAAHPTVAVKRLPPFPDRPSAEAYSATFGRYLEVIADRGVDVVSSTLVVRDAVEPVGTTHTSRGEVIVYCLQPILDSSALAVNRARDDSGAGERIIPGIIDRVVAAVDGSVGLDAQLSNWAEVDGELRYLDVTTPMLRATDGTDELDARIFVDVLPWALRGVVGRFVAPGIFDRYHDPRTVVLDLAGNLHKEDLSDLVPVVLDAAAGRVEPDLDVDEVVKDYRSDARMWSALQAVRRADRWWRRRIRRRPYPYLLPGKIDR